MLYALRGIREINESIRSSVYALLDSNRANVLSELLRIYMENVPMTTSSRVRIVIVALEVLTIVVAGGLLLAHFLGFATSSDAVLPTMRIFLLGVLVVGCLCMLSIVGLASYIVHALIRPKRSDSFIPLIPYTLDLPAEEVTFSPLQGEYRVSGLYIPSPNATSTILICPGFRRTYRDVLGMCKHLWQAGHNILAFEYHGHGTIVGVPVTLGYREINDFLGAVEYAKLRAPHTRLGALGYSMGGAISIIGSSRASQVEAVVADCAFATQWGAVEMAVHRTLPITKHLPVSMLRFLRQVTDLVLWLRAGYHFQQVEPVRDIEKIAPRPILLIQGKNDTVVNPNDALSLYEAAGEPKEIWMLPDTEHIRGYFTDSATYVTKVTNFFAHSLSPKTTHDRRVSQRADFRRTECVGSSVNPPPKQLLSPPLAERNRGHSSFAKSYGGFVYRFRWIIVTLWTLVLLASAPFASRVTAALTNSGYSITGSESMQVNQVLTNTLHQPATQILVVLHADRTLVSTPAYQQEIRDVVARAKQLPHVMSVTQAKSGSDGRTAFLAVGLNLDKDAVAQHIPDLREHLTLSGKAQPATISLTGDSVVANEVELTTQSDTEIAEQIALPITLLVLLIVFGTASAALMPLLLAGASVVTALAVVYGVASHIETNIFAYNIVSVIGLGLAIDYSLFVVRRFREELAQGYTTQQAIEITIATAGEAILFSATIVVIGFAGLLLIGIEIMSSFAIGGIAVAAIAALAALTLLPALLSTLGPRINALRVPLLARWSERRPQERGSTTRGIWQRWAFFVMRWPIPIIVLVLGMLTFLGWPARQLNPGMTGVDALPSTNNSRQAFTLLSQQFPQENFDPLVLIARSPDGSSILSPQNLERIDALTAWIAQQRHVTQIVSLTRPPQTPGAPSLPHQQLIQLYRSGQYQKIPALSQLLHQITSGDTTVISIRVDTISGSQEDQALISHLRAPSPAKVGLITQVGGTRAINMDFTRVLYGNFVRTLIFILAATFVLLLITFRSLLLPLKAIVMNILSISASYGALVWIFQNGNFQSQLGFTANGIIDRFIPPLLFCILFGLSMDYEVFLLSRVREEWLRTHDNQKAVALGVERTGSVISNAAILFMIVSGAFILTKLIVTKQLGLGITVAIGVDSTIIRLLLVPATMRLLGAWNWWLPGHALPSRTIVEADISPVRIQQAGAKSLSSLAPPVANREAHYQAQVELQLMHLFAQVLVLRIEQVRGNSDFFLCGGDSDSLRVLLNEIEQQFRVSLDSEDVFDHPVLFRLAALLVKKQQQEASLKNKTAFRERVRVESL